MGSGSYYSVLFVQAEDGIRSLVRSRGLGDGYKRQLKSRTDFENLFRLAEEESAAFDGNGELQAFQIRTTPYYASLASSVCLLYTSDAAAIYSV